VRFPEFDAAQWHELERMEHPADARHEWPMTFLTLERVELSASGPRRCARLATNRGHVSISQRVVAAR